MEKFGEFHTCTANYSRGSPTSRDFYLVTPLRHERIGDVYRTRIIVGTDVFENLTLEHFIVKLLCSCQFAHGALQGFDGEEIAWLCTDFTTNHVVIHTVVT